MTINPLAGRTPGADKEPRWVAPFTEREGRALGIDRPTYRTGCVYAETAYVEGALKGLPPRLREPSTTQNDLFTAPYIEDGEAELSAQLGEIVDPQLDDIQDSLEGARNMMDALDEKVIRGATLESGEALTNEEAVQRTAEHDAKIKQDTQQGRTHHLRSSRALMVIGRVAPWVEAIGFLAFVAYYLNVPLLEPWLDFLGWTFSLAVVVFIVVGQTYLVDHGARAHNHAREDAAEGNRHEAEKAFHDRNWYLALASVTAAAITGGMIFRAIVALGDAEIGTVLIMIALAAITGLLMPLLAYLGIAGDGSMVSRERDHLIVQLDEDAANDLEDRAMVRTELTGAEVVRESILKRDLPAISDAVQETVDACYYPYNVVRMLIGNLEADPPKKTSKTISTDATGRVVGVIGVSMPGARTVDLSPLLDRVARLADLDAERAEHLLRLDAMPDHPWAAARKR